MGVCKLVKGGLGSQRVPGPGPAGAATLTHCRKAGLGQRSALGTPPLGAPHRASTGTFLQPGKASLVSHTDLGGCELLTTSLPS